MTDILADKQYSERSIRKANANFYDLETASERLGHASTATTKKAVNPLNLLFLELSVIFGAD